MPSWSDLVAFLKWLVKEAPGTIDRRFLVAVAIGVFAIVGPEAVMLEFGSPGLKAALIRKMVSNADEYRAIVHRLAKHGNNQASVFAKGAAQAGFFTAHDIQVVREWTNESGTLSWSKPIVDDPALQDARARAETHRPPFQPVGTGAVVASPDCRIDRPRTGEVFLNQKRHLTHFFKPDDIVKIVNAAGGGLPVIARVAFPDRKMPDGIDLSLNKYQMQKMLGQLGSAADVLVSISSDTPNQNEDDDEPNGVKRCGRPDVR